MVDDGHCEIRERDGFELRLLAFKMSLAQARMVDQQLPRTTRPLDRFPAGLQHLPHQVCALERIVGRARTHSRFDIHGHAQKLALEGFHWKM